MNIDCCIIKPNGDIIPVKPDNGEYFTLEELKEAVGGYIEYCETIYPVHTMVIDEEGKLKGKEYNPIATELYRYAKDSKGNLLDVIVGDVLYSPKSMHR